ncbi:Peptidoglycan binding-like [uncultured Caudovirales phage]|uniref:Peptidoglycan binding-like n=1 Tax=uncultured Caudovirales phage TaxID=2100421 RepID=A0A6J5QWW0_9CAUD|nr:Peptidoglycan binding-like [uncultured Caudovirales phage]CAB4175108.1 Peptidoglycan binding-like [uncultured Caudovirales phage]CAB4179121.1 Peptidoglycan binding-like [uncultured Caudovirales phage]CAB4189080.1 Peptidoglycan binding-like [uncultured Caudovirales phage]CAB4193103.1 Peptidoglycan binding-like [uncultured Caudovirales phage]
MSLGNVGNPVPPVTSAQPGTAARMLEVARSQVGVVEGPKDNETIYGAFTKANFQPWCGSLMAWCAEKAKVTIPSTVYTPTGVAGFKKAKRWADAKDAHPQPGDLVYFSFVAAAKPTDPVQHVGIVLKDNGDGTITTIEGNTAGSEKGSQNNGGECAIKVRGYKVDNKRHIWSSVVGFGRPDYDDAVAGSHPATPSAPKAIPAFPGTIQPGDKGEGVNLIQQALDLDADGEYGPATKKAIIAIQNSHDHLDSNGIVGPATWAEIMKHLD